MMTSTMIKHIYINDDLNHDKVLYNVHVYITSHIALIYFNASSYVEVLLQPSRLAGTLQVICTEAENDIPVYVPIHVLDLNHPLANPATPTC